MASLASQLQRLQFAPEAAVASSGVGATTGTALRSFLFNAKEARGVELGVACALGENGLAQLVQAHSPTAAAFAPLFGPRSASVQRELQTAEANADLDARLGACLRHLGPFLQQTCAHKMLEWLVRRYRVHEYCAEVLLEAALPYHGTNLFARVVRLLPLDRLAAHWQFLAAVQKTGAPLDRLTLVRRCLASPALLQLVAELVPRAESVSPPPPSLSHLVALYASVAAGVLAAGAVTDVTLKALLPSLVRGLKSESLEQRAAAHVVAARLLASTPLEPRLTVVLADVLCAEAAAPAFATGSLQCLALLCQTQTLPNGELPPASLTALLAAGGSDGAKDTVVAWIAPLQELAAQVNVQPLLRVLLASLFACADETAALPAAEQLVAELRLAPDVATVAVAAVLARFCAGEPVPAPIQAMARRLEARHGSLVDRELGRRLREARDESTRAALSRFLASRVGGLRHATVSTAASNSSKGEQAADQQLTLFLGLRHADASVRCLALEQLRSLFSPTAANTNDDGSAAASATANDRAFLCASLLQCLADPSADVVLATLDMPDVLLELVPMQALEPAVVTTLRRAAATGSTRIAAAAAAVLCRDMLAHAVAAAGGAAVSSVYAAQLQRVVRAVLPLTLLTDARRKVARAVTRRMADSPVLCHHPLLSGLPQLLEDPAWKATAAATSSKALRAANDALLRVLAQGAVRAASASAETGSTGSTSAPATLPAGLCWLLPASEDTAGSTASASYADSGLVYMTMAVLAAATDEPSTPAPLRLALARWLAVAVATINALTPPPTETDPRLISMAATSTQHDGEASRVAAELGHLMADVVRAGDSTESDAAQAKAKAATLKAAALPVHNDAFRRLLAPCALAPERSRARQLAWLAATLAVAAGALPVTEAGTATERPVLELALSVFATASDAPLPGVFAASIQAVVLRVSPALVLGLIVDAVESGRVRVGALLSALYSADMYFEHAASRTLPATELAACCRATAPLLVAAFHAVPHVRSAAAAAAGSLARLLAAADASAVDSILAVEGALAGCTATLSRLAAERHTVVGDPKAVCSLLKARPEDTPMDTATPNGTGKRNRRSSKGRSEKDADGVEALQRLAETGATAEVCLAWAFSPSVGPRTRAAVVHLLRRHHSARKAALLLPHLATAAAHQAALPVVHTADAFDLPAASSTAGGSGVGDDDARSVTQALLGVFCSETALAVRRAAAPLPEAYVTALTRLLTAAPRAAAHQDAAEDRLHQVQLHLLQRELRPSFFQALSARGQGLLLGALSDLARQPNSAVLVTPLRGCLGKLPLSATLVAHEVARCLSRAYERHGVSPDGAVATTPVSAHAGANGAGAGTPKTPVGTASKRRKGGDSSVEDVTAAAAAAATAASAARGAAVADALASVTFLLEVLLAKPLETFADFASAVPPLFQLLGLRQALGRSVGEVTEHATQTLLGVLTRLLEAANPDDLDAEELRASVVVQCLRESEQPQTHNAALLLLAAMARSAPAHVVAVLMPLFSFMGAQSVRRDDAYTFRVLERTIEGVVPPALATVTATGKDSGSSDVSEAAHVMVAELCSVFVASFHTIPEHRRLPLFRHLAAVLGAQTHLHTLSSLLLRLDVLKPGLREADLDMSGMGAEGNGTGNGSSAATTGTNSSSSSALYSGSSRNALLPQFVLSLCLGASLENHFKVLLSLVEVARRLPVQRDANPAAWAKGVRLSDGKPVALLLDPGDVTPRQLRHFKYLVVRQVSSHLNSSALLKALRAAEADTVQAGVVRGLCLRLSEALLTLCSVVREQADEAARQNADEDRRAARLGQRRRNSHGKGNGTANGTDAGHDAGSRRYWSQLQTDAFVALHRINALLSPADFAAVVGKLLQHGDASVKRRALEMLAQRVEREPAAGSPVAAGLQVAPESLSRAQTDALLALLPAVVALMCQAAPLSQGGAQLATPGSEARTMLQQAAMHTYTVLVGAFGTRRPEPFEATVPQILALLAAVGGQDGADAFELTASVLACMGALAAALGPRFLAALAQFGPALARQLRRALALPVSGAALGRHALLLQACFGALRCLVTRLPAFIGPYLADYLSSLAHPLLMRPAVPAAADNGGATDQGKDKDKEEAAAALPPALQQRAAALRRLIATAVPARLQLPQIFAAYSRAVPSRGAVPPDQGHTAAALLTVLRLAVENTPRADLAAHLRDVFGFFRRALDFRTLLAIEAGRLTLDGGLVRDDSDDESDDFLLPAGTGSGSGTARMDQDEDSDASESAAAAATTTAQQVHKKQEESEEEEEEEEDEDNASEDESEDGSEAGNAGATTSTLGLSSGALTRYRSSEVDAVEAAVVEAVVATALRLSDASFRPEFLLFLDWARQSVPQSRRLVTLFRLVAHMAKTLKQFFVPYFAHLLKLCLEVLEGAGCQHLAVDERRLLTRHVLTSLRCCFQYDEDEFMTKERFNGVYSPLVQQLERGAEEDAATYLARAAAEVQPCLVQLAVCANDEARWKDVNSAVLEMTRSSDPAVRRAALLVVQGFYEQLGEEFLGLLPESVLYLAELLEDDDQDVENTCQAVVATIEKHLGEPLSKYF